MRRRSGAWMVAVVCTALGVARSVSATPLEPTAEELKQFSLEELLSMEITTASRQPEKYADAASAVFVITQEDIRRAGASSIPEALRVVPGLQVARIDASTWAITARGFNGTTANKLLVLIDGRSVYTPLYSGVFWDVQDLPMEDIQRIEVIRGPGATMWGSNAVNGVINIITFPSGSSGGAAIGMAGGTTERLQGTSRWGGKVGETLSYRAYGKTAHRVITGDDIGDRDWSLQQGGARLDWEPGTRDRLSLDLGVYSGGKQQTSRTYSLEPPYVETVDDDATLGGGHAVVQWTRTASENTWSSLTAYYDRTERLIPRVFQETRDTFDAELQHAWSWGAHQRLMAGAGFRASFDETQSSLTVAWDPNAPTDVRGNLFVQDEFGFLADRLFVTLGSKLEYNNYTQFELQPSARVLWRTDRHRLWAAAQRAVRTPTRLERDARITAAVIPDSIPALILLTGNDQFESEEVTAYDVGYRYVGSHFASDAAVFYNRYRHLRNFELGETTVESSPAPDHYVVPFFCNNNMKGYTYGAEISLRRQITTAVHLQLGYSYLRMRLETEDGVRDQASQATEGDNPQQQATARATIDLPLNLEADPALRYVDMLPNQKVPGYLAADLRLGWRPGRTVDVSVLAQDLFSSGHKEWGSSSVEMRKAVIGKVTWRP